MQTITGDYYDGQRAARHVVTLRAEGQQIFIEGEGIALSYPLQQLHVLPRVGKTPQRLELPDGGVVLSTDYEVILQVFGNVAAARAHRFESSVKYVAIAMVMLVITGWAGYRYGLPAAAQQIAQHIPPELESDLGEQALESLDDLIFKPSTLPEERQEVLQEQFERFYAHSGLENVVRLEFRDGGFIKANALALPGGIVVVTDQLVKIMDNDHEVMAVLAHELGHQHHRHSLRITLQNSMTALVAMAVYGDVSSISDVAATMPTVLMHTSFSRDFEREADGYAFALLKKAGRSPLDFAAGLKNLTNAKKKLAALEPSDKLCRSTSAEDGEADKDDGDEEKSAKTELTAKDAGAKKPGKFKMDMDYISTHPNTEERIRNAEAAARK